MEKQNSIDKYLYSDNKEWAIRLSGLIGTISTIILFVGLIRFFNLSIWYWVLFFPIAFVFVLNRVTRYATQIFFQNFSSKKHKEFVEQFWKKANEPSVDVFLPYAGESLSIYESVVRSAIDLKYSNKKIYLLDDKGDKKVETIAKRMGCVYLSRPNKGEYRKAGNLQFGYDNSQGKYVFVLDADFLTAPTALLDLIPYLESDSSIGILQTPQYFEQSRELNERNPIQFGGGNVVEDFYRLDLPSRNVFDAAICVGTSAVYRRQAIVECGGTPKVWGTEDVRQGLKITRAGYKVKYIPLIVSIGDSPDTMQGYFRQHNKWCTGSVTILFEEYFTKAKLNPIARIIYLTNATYYLSEGLSLLFAFHLLALIAFHSESLNIINTLWFVPYLLYFHVITPLLRINKPKFGTYLAAYSNIFTYFYTLPRLFFKQILPWEPAGAIVKSKSKEFIESLNQGATLVTIFFVGLVVSILLNPAIISNVNAWPPIAWSIYNIIWYAIYLKAAYRSTIGLS